MFWYTTNYNITNVEGATCIQLDLALHNKRNQKKGRKGR